MNEPRDVDDPNPPAEERDHSLDETNLFRAGAETDSLEVSGFLGETTNPESDLENVVFEAGPTDLNPGDALGKYQVKKKLGQGGMGAVYLGFDPMIEREVAIKVLTKTANASAAFDRFLAEARATGKLNHPNVVAIYDIDQEEETAYIVMELVRGGSGSEYIENRQKIDWLESLRIAAQAADGLAAAHRAELVHRDIKPENLMLSEEGTAKVVDFGLSKLVDSAAEQNLNLTNEGMVLGTPRYMSPEQFDSESVVDSRSDVYCLGGTLFSLLTSQFPFAKANNMIAVMKAHVAEPPPDPREYNPELPPSVFEIISKSMAKNPDDRYQDAGEMAEALWALYDAQRSPGFVEAGVMDDGLVEEEFRNCTSALIVEPSKMQAMMLAKQIKAAGVESVQIVTNAAAATEYLQTESPDLLISAKQLSDMDGASLLEEIASQSELSQSTLVLNTSDVDQELLLAMRHASTIGVVSKKTKPLALVRALFAGTYFDLKIPDASRQVDTLKFRLGIVSDSTRIPESIESLVRQSNILDLNIATFDQVAAGTYSIGDRDLVIALRNAGETENDHRDYLELVERLPNECKNLAAVQVKGKETRVRALRFGEFSASVRLRLDENRWSRLLTVCSH